MRSIETNNNESDNKEIVGGVTEMWRDKEIRKTALDDRLRMLFRRSGRPTDAIHKSKNTTKCAARHNRSETKR